MKPERQGKLEGEEGSRTERRGVVISMTGGVEGAERVRGGRRGRRGPYIDSPDAVHFAGCEP